MSGRVGEEEPSPEGDGDAEWPDDKEEAAFLSEAAARGEVVVPAAPPAVAGPADPLPPLDVLVNQVPAPLRDLLDDLFRAKFTGVRRFTAAETEAPAQTRR